MIFSQHPRSTAARLGSHVMSVLTRVNYGSKSPLIGCNLEL